METNTRQFTEERPAEDLPARVGEVEAVRGLFLALERAVRVVHLYPPANKVYVNAAEGLHHVFEEFLRQFGKLEIEVRERGFRFLERTVYEEPKAAKSLAMQLFRDGVRFLTFSPGLEQREVVGLLEVLGTRIPEDDLDRDVVTMLWEQEFSHLSYFVIDSAFDDDLEPDLARSLTGIDMKSALLAEEKGGVRYSPPKLAGRTLSAIMAITEQDLKVVRNLLSREAGRNLQHDLTTMLFEILNLRADSESFHGSVAVLGDLAVSYVRSDQLEAAREVVANLREFREHHVPATHAKVIAREIERIGGPDTMTHLRQFLKRPLAKGGKELTEFLRLLGPERLPEMIDLCIHAHDPGPVAKVIFDLSGGPPRQLLDRIEDPDPMVVRRVVSVLGAMDDPSMAEKLVDLLDHPAPDVRLEVVRVLGDQEPERARAGLSRAIRNDDQQVRVQALRALGAQGDSTTLPFLLKAIEDRAFRGKSVDERVEFFRAVARIGGDAVVPLLERHLDRRSLFARRAAQENSECAARALATISSDRAKEALVRRLTGSSAAVRTACEKALRRVQTTFLAGDDEDREEPGR